MTTNKTRKSIALLLAAVPLLALGLTGCAGGPSSADPAPSSSTGLTLTQWRLKMAECLREQGVDVGDPDADGNQSTSLQGADQDQFAAASKTCRGKLGPAPAMSAAEKKQAEQQQRESALKMAKCYRDNGVDVADPEPGQLPEIPSNAPESVQQQCGGGSQMVGRANP